MNCHLGRGRLEHLIHSITEVAFVWKVLKFEVFFTSEVIDIGGTTVFKMCNLRKKIYIGGWLLFSAQKQKCYTPCIVWVIESLRSSGCVVIGKLLATGSALCTATYQTFTPPHNWLFSGNSTPCHIFSLHECSICSLGWLHSLLQTGSSTLMLPPKKITWYGLRPKEQWHILVNFLICACVCCLGGERRCVCSHHLSHTCLFFPVFALLCRFGPLMLIAYCGTIDVHWGSLVHWSFKVIYFDCLTFLFNR